MPIDPNEHPSQAEQPKEGFAEGEAMPEVFVPEWPEDKLLYSSALMSLRCFDTPSISQEDRRKIRRIQATITVSCQVNNWTAGDLLDQPGDSRFHFEIALSI